MSDTQQPIPIDYQHPERFHIGQWLWARRRGLLKISAAACVLAVILLNPPWWSTADIDDWTQFRGTRLHRIGIGRSQIASWETSSSFSHADMVDELPNALPLAVSGDPARISNEKIRVLGFFEPRPTNRLLMRSGIFRFWPRAHAIDFVRKNSNGLSRAQRTALLSNILTRTSHLEDFMRFPGITARETAEEIAKEQLARLLQEAATAPSEPTSTTSATRSDH